jgi:hypothetical protein
MRSWEEDVRQDLLLCLLEQTSNSTRSLSSVLNALKRTAYASFRRYRGAVWVPMEVRDSQYEAFIEPLDFDPGSDGNFAELFVDLLRSEEELEPDNLTCRLIHQLEATNPAAVDEACYLLMKAGHPYHAIGDHLGMSREAARRRACRHADKLGENVKRKRGPNKIALA